MVVRTPFFLGVVAISVILTPMFNAARGSLLVAALFHAQMNGLAWPDAQPWDMPGSVAVAVVVVWLNRHTMLTRGTGATDVLMAATDSPQGLDVTPAELLASHARPASSSARSGDARRV